MNFKLTYPLKESDFLHLQEECAGRKLSDRERDCTIQAAQIINDAYEDGKNGAPADFVPAAEFFRMIGKPDRLNDPVVKRFCDALLFWMDDAYAAGVAATA